MKDLTEADVSHLIQFKTDKASNQGGCCCYRRDDFASYQLCLKEQRTRTSILLEINSYLPVESKNVSTLDASQMSFLNSPKDLSCIYPIFSFISKKELCR